MSLTLMYITNKPDIALIAQRAGVDRIWIDMEYIGKDERQAGLDTVKSHHTVDDITRLRPIVTSSELMVRVNPIHEASEGHVGSEEEIERVIESGADLIMLPFFKTPEEAERFVSCVRGRARTMLLVETVEAVKRLDEIMDIPGIDEFHIGLNDLHLAYGLDFMFELLCDGTVRSVCQRLHERGFKYGFGGIARVGYGLLPAEYIIAEHYANGSTAAILSRDFCNANKIGNAEEIRTIFEEGVRGIRAREAECARFSPEEFAENHRIVVEKTAQIAVARRAKRAGA